MDLGFNNLSFFNKFFRRNVGMTPQEYRGKSYTYSCYQKNIRLAESKNGTYYQKKNFKGTFYNFYFCRII